MDVGGSSPSSPNDSLLKTPCFVGLPDNTRGFSLAALHDFNAVQIQRRAKRFGRVPQRRCSVVGGAGSLEMGVENLKVVFLGNPFAVAEPGRDDVTRESLGQFRLT